MLLEAGHSVVGIDQSAGMLARARERFPEARYVKMGLQEMSFREALDGLSAWTRWNISARRIGPGSCEDSRRH
jgi:hypothetical protein